MLDRVADDGTISGGFNLLLNPFVLLGIAPTATAPDVNRAYEDAVEHGTIEADALRRAQHVLLAPRLRIDAEVGGLLDVASPLVTQLITQLRTDTNRKSVDELIAQLPALPKTNVLTHLAARSSVDALQLFEIIEAQACIVPAIVHDTIRNARKRAGTTPIELNQVAKALSRLEDQQIKAIVVRLVEENNYASTFTEFVRRVVATGSALLSSKLATFVRAYSKAALPELSRRRERVITICNSVRDNPESDIAVKRLLRSLRQWNEIGEPVQIFESYLQREEPLAREIYEHVRELGAWLNNKKSLSETAHTITLACADIFKALPRAANEMRQYAEIYAGNISIHRTKAGIRREIETNATDGNWAKAIALLENLITAENDLTKADALRKMRDDYNGHLTQSIKSQAEESAQARISADIDAERKAKEEAQRAYRGAAGQREKVGAVETGPWGARPHVRPDHDQRRSSPRRLVAPLLIFILFGGFIFFIMMLPPRTQTFSKPPESQLSSSSMSSTFTLTRALVSKDIDSAGQLIGTAATFRGPTTSVVGYASWKNGRPNLDAITLTLSGSDRQRPCRRLVITYASGNIWCKWNDIRPGDYKIEFRLNELAHKEVSFIVTNR